MKDTLGEHLSDDNQQEDIVKMTDVQLQNLGQEMNSPLDIQSHELLQKFDQDVLGCLIDWNNIDNHTLAVFDMNIRSRSSQFKTLVAEAIATHQQLDGSFGKYIAGLITLRQVILLQAGQNPDEFIVNDFLETLLGISGLSETPLEEVIAHWDLENDPYACFCDAPLMAKRLVSASGSYEGFYTKLRNGAISVADLPSMATAE